MSAALASLELAEPVSPPATREDFHHPYAVLRVAGLPMAMAEALMSPELRRSLDAAVAARAEAAASAEQACEALERAIGDQGTSDEDRRRLLKAKRNLFNGRPARLEGSAPTLRAQGSAEIEAADAAIAAVADREAAVEAAYAKVDADTRTRLRALSLEDENFLRAVAFSAPQIIESLREAVNDPEKFTGKRGRNLDTALINYFLRGSVKVSPLSYFGPVLSVPWTEIGSDDFALDGAAVESRVEVSRRALAHVLAALARDLKFWGDAHPLTLNPTLSADADAVEFTEVWGRGPGSGRTWGVYPPRSRLPASPRVLALVEHYRSLGPDAALSLRALFAALQGPPFDAAPAAFAGFVASAVRAGLLLPAMDVYEQGDLEAYLDTLFAGKSPAAAEAFGRLRAAVAGYAEAGHRDRHAQSGAIAAAYTDLCVAVGAAPLLESKSPLFYEDCRFGGVPAVPVAAYREAIADLHGVSALFPLLDYNHIIQSAAAGLFLNRYARGAQVRATDCIESIADEAQGIAQRLTALPLEEQERQIAAVSGTASALMRGKRLLLAELRRRMGGAGPVELDAATIREFAALVPDEAAARATSYTVIGQTDGEGADRRFVINRLYSGNSMLMSRFLRDAPQAGVDRVAAYIERLAGGARPVEIPGVFGFNANIHPRFVDTELSMAGRRPNYPDTAKLPVDDLTVRYDEELDRLMFVAPDGRDVSVQYFGFLNLMILPNIYQVLGRMNLQGLILDLWQDLFFAGLLPPDEVGALARVTHGGVVLSRRSRLIPFDRLPPAKGSEIDFYRGLHALLAELGEHDDLYVRLIADRDDFFGSADGGESMADTTDFKPALLSLDLPLTVQSLQRRLRRRPRGLLLQEALPGVGRGGIAWDGARHACEVQLEIARTKGR